MYAVGSLESDTFTFYTQEIEVGVESADEDSGDGTPAPTEVNTGSPADSNSNIVAITLGALAFVLAAGAVVARRRVPTR